MATDFQDKEMLKAGSNNTCLAVITIDSTLKKDENYYPQVHLKECKYIEKEVLIHIIGTWKFFQLILTKANFLLIKHLLKIVHKHEKICTLQTSSFL